MVMGTASAVAPKFDSAEDPGESSKIDIMFEDATMSSLDGGITEDED